MMRRSRQPGERPAGPPWICARRLLGCGFALCLLTVTVGCGGGAVAAAAAADKTGLMIAADPENATAPLGGSAVFRVVAQGPGTLSYQWLENSVPIAGATAATYTTPPVALSDAGTTYSVIVSDGNSSVQSTSATLSVGPRSPVAGDLRFQLVDSAAISQAILRPEGIYLAYPFEWTYPGDLGTPLRLGLGQCVPNSPQVCDWYYILYALSAATPGAAIYNPDVLENLGSDLATLTSAEVVTSLDIESQEDVFAISIMQGASDGFDYRQETASQDGLQAAISADGAAGRVVTAISYDDATGNVTFLSYGWTSNGSTTYETQVMTTPYDGIGAAAQLLAKDGDIITAFGGNATDGYILVGTRVTGDSIPRPLLASPATLTSTQGYALVGWAINEPYSANPSPPVWLFER